MSKTITPNSSKTDWARIDAMTDADIDTSGDAPAMGPEFFAKARLLLPGQRTSEAMPRKTPAPVKTETVTVELELDPVLLAWFQAQGEDYEQRMLAALRLYAQAHQTAMP